MHKNILGREIKKGVSILVASMNRNEQLEETIPTWLQTPVNEIIIIDWSSKIPISDIVKKFNDPRITVIRVQGKKYWVLTLAVNLAVRCTSRNNILKLDSDSKLAPDFLEKHPLNNSIFYAGDWRKATEKNQQHLNGIVYIKRRNFFKVHGYNEYIQTYGYDDCDLYDRLQEINLQRICINFTSIQHIEHSNTLRNINQKTERLDVEIEKNRLIANEIKWEGPMLPITNISQINDNYYLCKLSPIIPLLAIEIIDKCLENAWKNRNYAKKYNLYIKVQNGLGNRLRALASAFNIAKGSNRNLILIWEPNEHCEAMFNDLYDTQNLIDLIINSGITLKIVNDEKTINLPVLTNEFKEGDAINFYDYMIESQKNAYIDDTVANDIYIISACCLVNQHTDWEKECNFLKKLIPNQEVNKQIMNFENKLNKKNIKIDNCIGVHIRMSQPEKSYEDISNYSEEAKLSITKWRKASHWKTFFNEIKKILETNSEQKFLLCCDNEKAYQEIMEESRAIFKKKIFVKTEKNVYDRSIKQVQNGLVDLIMLSRTLYILGSCWSTFSEIAGRLSGKKLKLAGRDF